MSAPFRVFIDADGCPVVDEALAVARENGISVVIVCDTSHVFEKEGAETVTVSRGADSADYAIVNRLSKRDIVVTQDYGLAAMCLSRGALCINQNGLVFDEENILPLLENRAFAGKLRRTSPRTRLKGPKKRTPRDDKAFEDAFRMLISENTAFFSEFGQK